MSQSPRHSSKNPNFNHFLKILNERQITSNYLNQ